MGSMRSYQLYYRVLPEQGWGGKRWRRSWIRHERQQAQADSLTWRKKEKWVKQKEHGRPLLTKGDPLWWTAWFQAKCVVLDRARWRFVCLLFYFLASSNVILGWVQTCDSDAPWGNQATSTITYPTQSPYPDTEPSIPQSPILIIPTAWLGSDKNQF